MKRNKRRPETQKALMRRFTALVLGMWLLVMGLLTYAVAKDFYLQVEGNLYRYANMGTHFSASVDYPEDAPGLTEAGMIQALGTHYFDLRADQLFPFVQPHMPNSWGSDDWIWGKWDLLFGYEIAMQFRDDEGRTLMTSGNYVTFAYTDKQSWQAQDPEPMGAAYIDLDATEGCLETFSQLVGDAPYGAHGLSLLVHAMRMTGYFEGNQFYPVTIDRAYNMHPEMASEEMPICRMDARGYLDWTTIFTAPQPPDKKLVSIYGWDLGGILSDYEPVTVNGTRFETLTELLEAHIETRGYYKSDNLWSAVIINGGRMTFYAGGMEQTFPCAVAVRCWPMGYAAWRLIPTYLVSLAVAVFLLIRLRKRIRRSLIIPMENAITGIEQWIRPDPWHEPYLLAARLTEAKESLSSANAKIQQLETALDYAKDAEENRRQLVSNITHELKTPLAVIHSYAEGLQSDIPAEKKEKYLSVILEEAERMDAMVLQMLDLSRLEAGKVRLASDPVSLLRLTERILEKFALSIQEKALTVSFAAAEDFEFTADEARVTQVITNLLSNAVKYSGQEGKIRLWIYKDAGGARFHISNTAPPLSKEALEKVFDSFYRADPSRSEPGTGLGLAIVKRIVELHRGSCSVQNTTYQDRNYVQFCVRLPLS